MKRAVWVLQILLAVAFVAAGSSKLLSPREQLVASGMGWASDFSETSVKLIGAAEVAGAVGLIVPAATGIVPVLTTAAAGGLAVLMGGATMTHVLRNENFLLPFVLMVLATAVVLLRTRQ